MLTPDEKQFVDQHTEADTETSTVELQGNIEAQFGKGVSLSTISRVCDKLGWTRSRVLCGKLFRNVNKAARLAFVLRMVEEGETFDDIIFTDESTFWVENHSVIITDGKELVR